MDMGQERLAEIRRKLRETETKSRVLSAPLIQDLTLVLALSDFVYRAWQANPRDLASLLDTDALETPRSNEDFESLAAACCQGDLDLQLRRLRRREQCRFIFRDLSRRADLQTITSELSGFADTVVRTVAVEHYRQLCAEYGQPLAASGTPLQMAILALGKLGGGELNLSSDIDLVFFYAEPGDQDDEAHLEHQAFFLRLARRLIASLNDASAEGFVFRVDMRLRPYGESGELVPSLRAMENYFVNQGRDWERYAFIKARSIALDDGLGASFLDWLKPFVYRRYLDFGALAALRSMKLLVAAEVKRKRLHDDVKLGSGGIRDVEFIVQTMQLIFGAHNAELRCSRLLQVLPVLVAGDLLSREDGLLLQDAYSFLRDVEHRLQAEADRQTQLLPDSELSQARLALSMGYASWHDFVARLDGLRKEVARIFAAVLHMPATDEETGKQNRWIECWLEPDRELAASMLSAMGMGDAESVRDRLLEFRKTLDHASLEPMVEDRFNNIVPKLLDVLAGLDRPAVVLSRILSIATAVLRRSTYIAFLLESGRSIETLVEICGLSPWVADQLSAQPILLYQLDYLKGRDYLPDVSELRHLLEMQVSALELDDLEAQMDTFRRFKLSQEFDTAILALTGDLPVEEVSNQLTRIAEVVLDQVSLLAWRQLVERYGRPGDASGIYCDPGFVILAYGKLGGYELGFGSDLDLVFLHGDLDQGRTEGPREVPNETFFARLGQRIIHILTNLTAFGRLYEADIRLRPFGDSGPPVASFASFESYQRENAWTWEHQALVRARALTGDPKLIDRFADFRRRMLAEPRDEADLRQAVVSMRQRMRRHQATGTGQKAGDTMPTRSLFDLKQEMGAIVDIEFLVQYLVLREAGQHPALLSYTDNLRILDALEQEGLLSLADRKLLREAYLAYRTAVHFEALGGRLLADTYQRLDQLRIRVVDVLQRLFQAGQDSTADG